MMCIMPTFVHVKHLIAHFFFKKNFIFSLKSNNIWICVAFNFKRIKKKRKGKLQLFVNQAWEKLHLLMKLFVLRWIMTTIWWCIHQLEPKLNIFFKYHLKNQPRKKLLPKKKKKKCFSEIGNNHLKQLVKDT